MLFGGIAGTNVSLGPVEGLEPQDIERVLKAIGPLDMEISRKLRQHGGITLIWEKKWKQKSGIESCLKKLEKKLFAF